MARYLLKVAIRMLFLVTACLGLVACNPSTPTPQTPKISEVFKDQLIQYLKDGGKLATMAAQGMDLNSFASALAESQSTFSLLKAAWPQDFSPGLKESFEEAQSCYGLALLIWQVKSEDRGRLAMNQKYFKWTEVTTHPAAMHLTYDHEYNEGVFDDDGKNPTTIPYNNINRLLAVATEKFENGRDRVMQQLK